MYLRGKLEGTEEQSAQLSTNNSTHDEIPDIAEIINDA